MPRRTVFDPEAGESNKQTGQDRAEAARNALCDLARTVACHLACANAPEFTVTIDDVQLYMSNHYGMSRDDLGNGAGSIFKDKDRWEFVNYTKSLVPERHRGVITVWRLLSGARGIPANLPPRRDYESHRAALLAIAAPQPAVAHPSMW